MLVEEVPRGQPGYADWCRYLIELGHCTCDGCGGHLDGQVCISCGCTHWISEPTRHTRATYASWIPNTERCAVARADLAATRRQQEQDWRRAMGE